MRKTKIVCTLGPASSSKSVIENLISSGMNVARFNMSHGNYEEHANLISSVKTLRKKLNKPVAILMDTKGPEIRIKDFFDEKVLLHEGQEFVLTTRNILGDSTQVGVTYPNFNKVVKPKTKILIDDGNIELQVVEIIGSDVICCVKLGGYLCDDKSIVLPEINVPMQYLSEVDKLDILFGIKQKIDYVAISFVSGYKDVIQIRSFLDANGGENIKIISKIENRLGVENIDSIIEVSDGIMVARGSLAVEIEFKKVPAIQKKIIEKCRKIGKPVIVATQMLEGMIQKSTPSRAEILDIANAVLDGTSAVMLSGETAVGKFPSKCVKAMSDICVETEKTIKYYDDFSEISSRTKDISESIGYAACSVSFNINAKAIIVNTVSGRSALEVCKFHPQSSVFACTPILSTFYHMSLFYGVTPIMATVSKDTDSLLAKSCQYVSGFGYVKNNDIVIQTASVPCGDGQETNLIKVTKI